MTTQAVARRLTKLARELFWIRADIEVGYAGKWSTLAAIEEVEDELLELRKRLAKKAAA